MTTKFCKDCKFCTYTDRGGHCDLPPIETAEISMVDGHPVLYYPNSSCKHARASIDGRECGPNARDFQPSLTHRIVTFFKSEVKP